MNEELKRTVSLRVNYMTEAGFQLGYLKAENKTEGEIVAAIETHRKPFAEGRTVGLNGHVGATKEQWQAIARDSDKAAKAILLKNSAELSELERLEKIAEDARKAAEAKERQLNDWWTEYNNLPGRIEVVESSIAWAVRELNESTPDVIKANFATTTARSLLVTTYTPIRWAT
jgi:hypothetical protein